MADEKLDMDTVPAHIHEELRQVMLGERRRAEKAELEGQQVVEALLGEPVPVPLPTSYYPIAVAVRELRIQWREAERERDELDNALANRNRDVEELRKMLAMESSDRGRIEGLLKKAERERDAARNSKNDAIFGIHHGHANDLADALGCVNEHEGARQQPPWAEMIGMVERIRRERDEARVECSPLRCISFPDEFSSASEFVAELVAENTRFTKEASAALARVRELEADSEELEAFRWLKCWCEERGRMLRFALGNRIGIVGLDGDTWQPTPVALADKLDPNWRKAGSREE